MSYSLRDSYEVQGVTMETLEEEIRDMEGKTEYLVVEPKLITIASYKEKDQGTSKDVFFDFSKENLKEGLKDDGRFIPLLKRFKVDPKDSRVNEELMEESLASTGVVLIAPIKGKMTTLYVSPGGMAALADKAGVGGANVNTPSNLRDLYIAEGLFKRVSPVKLVVRTITTEDGRTDRKVFGVLSEKYQPISLELIPKTVKAFEIDGSMGTASLAFWRNSQEFTEAIVEYPDAADEMQTTYGLPETLIPGVRISTSDTGDASVRIQSTYRRKNGRTYVVANEVKKNHMGEISVEKILKEVKETIYAEISTIPGRMADLMGRTIGDGLVSTETEQKKNRISVERAIRNGIREMKIGKAIGRTRAKELSDQMIAEINPTEIYTECDIAMTFLGIGDRVENLPENARKALEKACAGAPFVDYQKRNTEVALLPEED